MPPATIEKPKTSKKAEPKKLLTFRLLRGRYIEPVEKNGKKVDVVFQVTFDPNTKMPNCPLIETEKELDLLFNVPGFAPKFERVGDQPVVVVDPLKRLPGETMQAFLARLSDLQDSIRDEVEQKLKQVDEMDEDALQEFALSEDIELGDLKNVAQIRTAIKKHLKG